MEDIYEKCQKNARPAQQKMEANLYKVRLLDIKAKKIENELRQKLIHLSNGWKRTGKDERRRQYEEIEKLFEKAKDLSDEKIRLAEGTYEMVDACIQKMDKELKNYSERAQREKTQSAAGTSKENICDEQPLSSGRRRGTAPAASMPTKRGANAGRTSAKETVTGKAAKAEGGTEAEDSATQLIISKEDMPIDPNEPHYCICQQVSFGQMVACDNKDCPLEWFHFGCVGLKSSPKGKWYCPQCREDRETTRRQQQQKTPRGGVRGKDIPTAGGRG